MSFRLFSSFLTAGNKSKCGTLQRLTDPQQSTAKSIFRPVSPPKRQVMQGKPSILSSPHPQTSSHLRTHRTSVPPGGRRGSYRAIRMWLRRPWAAAGPGHPRARPIGGRRVAWGAWPGFEPTRPATRQRHSAAGVEGAGGTGGHGRASRSTTPSRQARVWRSRGRPGPTAPGTPAAQQAPLEIWRDHSHNRQSPRRLLHNSPHGSSPRRPWRICHDV